MHALVAAVIAVFMSNPAIVPPSDVPLLLEQMEGQLADRDEEVRKLTAQIRRLVDQLPLVATFAES